MPSVNPFLEKLLQEDIRHERNVLLQCVNYVVRNNFFDPPPPIAVSNTTAEIVVAERTEMETFVAAELIEPSIGDEETVVTLI